MSGAPVLLRSKLKRHLKRAPFVRRMDQKELWRLAAASWKTSPSNAKAAAKEAAPAVAEAVSGSAADRGQQSAPAQGGVKRKAESEAAGAAQREAPAAGLKEQ